MPSPASTAPLASSGPTTAAPARPAAEIIAVTMHDDFLLELGAALGGQVAVRPVDATAGALEHLRNPRLLHVVALDARGIADVPAEANSVHAHSPDAAIVVFAPAESEKQVAASVKGSHVFAVLPIPVDRAKTAAVIEGALADAHAKRSAPATRPAAPKSHDARVDSGITFSMEAPAPEARTESTSGSGAPGGKAVLGAVAAAVVLAAAAGAWFLLRDAPQTPAAAGSGIEGSVPAEAAPGEPAPAEEEIRQKVVDTGPLVQGTVDELLEKARLAMRERRYTEPTGDNALLYYRSAIAVDPASAEARDGLARVATLLVTSFEEAVAEQRYGDAETALAYLKVAAPDDVRLGPLEWRLIQGQITAALADGNVDRSAALLRHAERSGVVPADQLAKWRTEVGRRQDEARVRRFVALANERIREGRLTEPAGDSAKHYVQQARELAARDPAVQRAARDLTTALLRRAREAAAAGRTGEADQWVAEARANGATSAEISAVQREAAAAARQRAASAEAEKLAQLARERLRDGRLTEPANDSAAHYLTALLSADADHSALAPARSELAAKLIERATAAAREGRTAQVEADLAAASRWGADPRAIQSVRQLVSARPSAAQPPSPEELRERLKRIRVVQPEYPQKALRDGVSGSVTLEFVVGKDGEPRDLRVVSSEPEGVFDRAALAAVRRWRYEPVIVDGTAYEVPVRTAIRFELPEE